MAEHLATFVAILAAITVAATVWTYERIVDELRNQVARRDEHIDQCEHLLASMVRHPAGQITPDLRIVREGEGA